MEEILAENLTLLEKRYRTTAIIYMAQFFFAISLIVVSRFITSDPENFISQSTSRILWIVVIFVTIAIFVLRRKLFRWERLRDVKLLKGISGVFNTLQINSIVLGILAGTIAVIGFIITMLGGGSGDMLRAGFVSLIIFLLNLPRQSVWRKIAANLEKV
jgi:hypothetical protein